mgnify:CR=1 FL=1
MGTRLLLVAVRAFPAVRAFLAVCTLFCFLVLLRSRGFFLGLPRSRGFFSSGFSAVRSLSSSSGFYMFSLRKPVEEESDLSALSFLGIQNNTLIISYHLKERLMVRCKLGCKYPP